MTEKNGTDVILRIPMALRAYADRQSSVALQGATVREVVRLVDRSEYKRRQSPPGVKITPKAFGRDRRLPITNRYRNRKPDAAPREAAAQEQPAKTRNSGLKTA